MDDVGLRKFVAIHIDLLVEDMDMVAGNSDHALYIVRVIVKWKFENDDVAVPDGPVREQLFIPRALAFKHKFIYQKMIANEQGWLHGLRRDFESLNDECGAE